MEKEESSSEVMRHVGSAFSLVRPKGGESNSGAASPLNSILPPSGGDDSSNASPLQRMASITNSLISQVSPILFLFLSSIHYSVVHTEASHNYLSSFVFPQPTAPSVASPNQRPLKAVLPPITQQQFDQYNNLNTEDIVRKVGLSRLDCSWQRAHRIPRLFSSLIYLLVITGEGTVESVLHLSKVIRRVSPRPVAGVCE